MKVGSSVLALDDDGQVYLIEEYKYGIRQPSIEVASGGIDAGETLLEAAKRELREEVGLEAADWVELGMIHSFIIAIDSPVHLFLARGLHKSKQALEPGEVIHVLKMTLRDAVEQVMTGAIQHGPTNVLVLKTARLLGL
jgi:ADP-ribose pyrophosphatase